MGPLATKVTVGAIFGGVEAVVVHVVTLPTVTQEVVPLLVEEVEGEQDFPVVRLYPLAEVQPAGKFPLLVVVVVSPPPQDALIFVRVSGPT